VLLSSALQVASGLARGGEGVGGGEDERARGRVGKGSSRLPPLKAKATVACTRCGKPSSGSVCGVCRMTDLVWQHSKYTGM
jgi:hypothetical protein